MIQPKEEFDAFLSIPYGREPEDQAYWQAVSAAIEEAASEISFGKIRIHRADREINALLIKKNVVQLIDCCDFTIGVIAGQNPNVFWEVGYTEAQGKPVVYLVDQEAEQVQGSPVLVSEALRCIFRSSDIINYIKSRKEADLKFKLIPFLDQAIKAVQAMPRQPKLAAFGSREDCKLPKLVSDAKERIHLITTNLSYFANADDFVIQNQMKEKQFAFDPPIERGVEVKILTMDPESPIVKYRAEQLGLDYDVGVYREELKSSARRFYQRYINKKNVSIRLYDDLPLQIALIVDEQVMTSIITRGSQARRNLHFIMDVTLTGADIFEKHFSEVAAGQCKHITAFKWAAETRPGPE